MEFFLGRVQAVVQLFQSFVSVKLTRSKDVNLKQIKSSDGNCYIYINEKQRGMGSLYSLVSICFFFDSF